MAVCRGAHRYWALAVLAAMLLAGLAVPAMSGYAAPAGDVKYYVVRPSYQGQPEYLPEIARRLLGDANRYPEIYNLNRGRVQPDGGRLSDPTVLRPGWLLVLPDDASGDGVVYGPLPTGTAPTPSSGSGATPSVTPSVTPAAPTGCATVDPVGTRDQMPWPQLRLAPDQAWERSRGDGVTVAVIDSGIDPGTPALAGRLAAGLDLSVAGGGCAGHGTAMAGIIAAQPAHGSGLVGIAPAATILPIAVDMPGGVPRADEVAKALEAAAAAGAAVIMVARPIDASDQTVSAAIDAATRKDVVVVLAAQPRGATAGKARTGVLRVGAVGADDKLSEVYPEGAVDVVAPGADVVSLSADGSAQIRGGGTDFAVPFVAGLAALVRSSYPGLTAALTVRRIELSADHSSQRLPDPEYGWGMINPGAAVTVTLTDEPGAAPLAGVSVPVPHSHSPLIGAAIALLVPACAVGVLLARRRWLRPR